ncbi:MAG: uncharacterized UPF0146 family protein [Natronomonas sp.]|uniref:UPF0146 family protein n=1 Tax=Natronomonas sp. TaxID=2184060 RepID=UPI00398A0ACC
MHTDSPAIAEALVDRLARYDTLVEVGVGNRHDVAAGLAARGRQVTATDIHERAVPEGVRFVRDDVTAPDAAIYRDADALYALNCPPELQRPLATAARRADADCLFTTLGTDPAVVDAAPETLPGDTLFKAES